MYLYPCALKLLVGACTALTLPFESSTTALPDVIAPFAVSSIVVPPPAESTFNHLLVALSYCKT